MRHDLKIWPKFFDMVRRGVKPFEVRSNDREFQECDTLLLQEYDPDAKVFTGNTLTCDVTCIVSGSDFGIKPGYVVMGIKVTGSHIANTVVSGGGTERAGSTEVALMTKNEQLFIVQCIDAYLFPRACEQRMRLGFYDETPRGEEVRNALAQPYADTAPTASGEGREV